MCPCQMNDQPNSTQYYGNSWYGNPIKKMKIVVIVTEMYAWAEFDICVEMAAIHFGQRNMK